MLYGKGSGNRIHYDTSSYWYKPFECVLVFAYFLAAYAVYIIRLPLYGGSKREVCDGFERMSYDCLCLTRFARAHWFCSYGRKEGGGGSVCACVRFHECLVWLSINDIDSPFELNRICFACWFDSIIVWVFVIILNNRIHKIYSDIYALFLHEEEKRRRRWRWRKQQHNSKNPGKKLSTKL